MSDQLPQIVPCADCPTDYQYVMVHWHGDEKRYYVTCARCCASGAEHDTKIAAISAWNRLQEGHRDGATPLS